MGTQLFRHNTAVSSFKIYIFMGLRYLAVTVEALMYRRRKDGRRQIWLPSDDASPELSTIYP